VRDKTELLQALKTALTMLKRGGYIGDADKWITTQPSGSKVLLGEGGEVKGGMGGKFNGKSISEVKSSPEKKAVPTQAPAKTQSQAPTKPAPAAATAAAKAKPSTGAKAHKAANVSLTSEETQSMREYTGSMYVDLNKRLRDGKPPAKGDAKDVANMDKAFAKSGTTEDIQVYRGVNGAQFKNLKPGQSIKDPAYTSTTTDANTANVFTGYGDNQAMLKITVPKGSKAISADKFTTMKGKGGKTESEIILDRGGEYVVDKVEPAKHGKPAIIHVTYKQRG